MVKLTPNASYSLAIRLSYPNQVGMLGKITSAIAQCGGSLGDILLENQTPAGQVQRQLIVDAYSGEQGEEVLEALRQIPQVEILEALDRTFELHRGGKLHTQSRIAVKSQSDLAMAYTPGVGRVCRAIAQDPEKVFSLTIKSNTVAVITDGSAVLGLGNLGAAGALPVMEGKAILFKEFANLDSFPICLDTQDTEEIITTVKHIAPVFGGINLEDISAPRCFEIERRLSQELEIPVFHDDQHGTAIVVMAAVFNALKLVKKALGDLKIVINGAGAAGIAIGRLLKQAGANPEQIILCDSKGIVSESSPHLTPEKQEFATKQTGSLADAMNKADIFIGVSVPNIVTPDMVSSMANSPIIMAMSNPIPEIQPELISDQVAVMATGRSDYPNQINNVLAFPGIFRGALNCRASSISSQMCLEAASAIASLISSEELAPNYIIPSVFDQRVATAVAKAVENTARN
ncbi:NAD-dependent malic enzyme [Euhalothece natronophila Z-M001]|uniref:NAD-dependent malic enzyme n=1 Tax=Euhalothece natronophila Z-M001 TaxID=522448 RepID=A0A5B8NKY2_9CHRO|nr:NAD-dependent malic enzyme [Euhalothece natronophila]QDZ39171.1 NAD-dependent malic enzyme [Euhalothece natronophila Z-M001]